MTPLMNLSECTRKKLLLKAHDSTSTCSPEVSNFHIKVMSIHAQTIISSKYIPYIPLLSAKYAKTVKSKYNSVHH